MFGRAVIWMVPRNHYNYSYFNLVNIKNINRNNEHPQEILNSSFSSLPELLEDDTKASINTCCQWKPI